MAVAAARSDGAACGVLSVQAAADSRTAGGGWGCVHDWSVGAHSLINTSISYTCLAQASHWQCSHMVAGGKHLLVAASLDVTPGVAVGVHPVQLTPSLRLLATHKPHGVVRCSMQDNDSPRQFRSPSQHATGAVADVR